MLPDMNLWAASVVLFLFVRATSSLQTLTSQFLHAKENVAFFNRTSSIQLVPSTFQNHLRLTFRTCVGGSLFYQDAEKSGNEVSLDVTEDGIILTLVYQSVKYESKLSEHFLDNMWHSVGLEMRPMDIILSVDDHQTIVANATHNSELMNAEFSLLDRTRKLFVGEQFIGCLVEEVGWLFNYSLNDVVNVEWGPCPLPSGSCSQCRKGNLVCAANARCEKDKTGNNVCVCDYGYAGVYPNCTEINSCIELSSPCLNGGSCVTSTSPSVFNCTCPVGFSGKLCQYKVKECHSSPCHNNGTCVDTPNSYICQCAAGFTGTNCEADIDECKLSQCKNGGHCINLYGDYQCFCVPGYTGDNCELDVDECLSQPCQNGATCINGQNRFTCKCPPGFTGKDCSFNVDECSSNPCLNNATCIDGNNSYICMCSTGFTGVRCEVNIDDCKASPCLNSGICIDAINSYTCNCTNTGFMGDNCEINIDDCDGNPCVNNGTCKDLIKDYHCECFPGYTGKDCQDDVNECDSNPCQYGGICLQRSNQTLYNRFDPSVPLPIVFSQEFGYSNALGYECLCVPGVTGTNCEIDIKECDSNPCHHGTCREDIGKYSCECNEGFVGTHCETEIDECNLYKPCVHGTCYDKVANYVCECPAKYGGKNCSVELIGCNQESACLNNGTCKPFLLGESDHRFNCTCPNGFHGDICEQVTTMSLNGEAFIAVNTTRDEGYDISFRFKTTLPSGLLALGKGYTFYILELMNGRLNLHSSLLNKWEGVFVGSGLNDSTWQKVFVAINSSHVVLAANEEQTIYPISFNDGGSVNSTSFPTTFVGGTVTNLRHLAHGPAVFIGCTENIVINGQWVTNETNNVPIEMPNVEFGCKREVQCKKDSCNGVGQCTDLWKNFTCLCQRPYFGNRCEYNVTAATFGHENITNSLVTVSISNQAKKAIRNIVDISMFVRTRQSKGAIFYLGSLPGSVMLNEETHVAAELVDGELLVRIHFHNTTEAYTVGGVKLNDGKNHLIQVIRNVTLIQVKINGTEYFRKTIGSSASLDAQVLYLGGYPVQANENDNLPAEMVVADSLKGIKDTASKSETTANVRYTRQTADKYDNIPHFKGVIQDVQINNGSLKMTIEIFPRKALGIPKLFGNVSFDSNTVLEGVLSDDTCAVNPCYNEANCTVTWNDFVCECTRGYKGKQCQDMEFCKLKDCPQDSECRNLPTGYECVTNLTLHGSAVNTSLQYSFVQDDKTPTNAYSVDIMYRSKTGGTLLYICNQLESLPDKHLYFFVFVLNDKVTVAWKLDFYSKEIWQSFDKEESDGEWSSITIKVEGNKIYGGFSGVENEAGQYFTSTNFSLPTWYSLISFGKIYVGGTDNNVDEILLSNRHRYHLDGGSTNSVEMPSDILPSNYDPSILQYLSGKNPSGIYYKGCLGEIRINSFLLPYFTESQLNNSIRKELNYFTLLDVNGDNIDYGCYLCFQTDCKNGGRCANEKQSYSCKCEPGFDGEDCSHDIDECALDKCQHGATCVDGVANYTCDCALGWTGWLCDTDIDECASQPCQNNGSCYHHLGYYDCTCTEEYDGKNCEHLKLVTCDSNPCKNGTCKCEDRNTCRNEPSNYKCECYPHFCGRHCEIRDPCVEMPCQNGGTCYEKCTDEPDYECVCVDNYAGKNCTEEQVNAVDTGKKFPNIAYIVGPISAVLVVALIGSLMIFLMMARNKRATRGTYSPSSQEYCNPRVELDNVMKPPPEERLI